MVCRKSQRISLKLFYAEGVGKGDGLEKKSLNLKSMLR